MRGGGKRQCGNDHCAALCFFLGSFLILGVISSFYAKIALTPRVRVSDSLMGCQPDNEGSWSVGVFYGDSPFLLKPIEQMNITRDDSAAWPVANPVLTCGSVSDSGFYSNSVADPFLYAQMNITRDDSAAWPVANPVLTCGSVSDSGFYSNSVADPFLYAQGDVLYLFFEMKNSVTMQGDIGVARSVDKGVTWQHLGIALDEEWHLSFPYVFDYNGQIYMMPEGSAKGDLRLYRVEDFPLKWKLEKIVMEKALVDSFIIHYNNKYWLFGSDHSGIGNNINGQLEIWYSASPLGPWKPHRKNPIYNGNKSTGARNGGRAFEYKGNLYRAGQDCGDTYGRRVRVFKIEILNENDFSESEVPLGLEEPIKGRNAWNGARYHHLDVQRLSSGKWIGVMDGDRVPSGDLVRRSTLARGSFLAVALLLVIMGVLLGAINCLIPLSWFPHNIKKRSDSLLVWEKSNSFSPKFRQICSRLNRACYVLRGMFKHNTCIGKLALALIFACCVALMCTGVRLIYGGNGAQEPYPFKGQYSQFTMLAMTYDARLWNLKMYVKHYSRCSSVREIVVVWNRGQPPELSEFDSVVPVRIRVEEQNSLNNRFKVDPMIETRGVLELDDDILMSCDVIERGFRVWRENPDRIVGFYPRLVNGNRLKYKGEPHARAHNAYNMILTGAAFVDSKVAFRRYWSENARPGREVVDKKFNCEDVLMNYLYANASSSMVVEYVKPAWAIDMSKLSGVAISRNTDDHYRLRSECLEEFAEIYGSLSSRKSQFNRSKDGWDV